MRVVIPAAGLGTRFLPLSSVVPKELLLLGDRPVLHHALDEAARAGFEAAVIVTAPWKRPLFERYFQMASPPIAVTYAEQAEMRGIGDAVLQAVSTSNLPAGVLLPDDVVTATDHWTRLLAEPNRPALCIREVPPETVGRFGIVEVDAYGHVQRVVEKPAPGTIASNLAIFGRYLVTEAVADKLRERATQVTGELQLTDGFAGVKHVAAVPFKGDIYDCGTPASYADAVCRWRA